MRLSFNNGETIRHNAKRLCLSEETRLTRWWSRRYNLPPNHPLLTSLTPAELQADLLTDLWFERESLQAELAGGNEAPNDRTEALMQRINQINGALGDQVEEYDPLVAQWEAELAAGIEPDLDEVQ